MSLIEEAREMSRSLRLAPCCPYETRAADLLDRLADWLEASVPRAFAIAQGEALLNRLANAEKALEFYAQQPQKVLHLSGNDGGRRARAALSDREENK